MRTCATLTGLALALGVSAAVALADDPKLLNNLTDEQFAHKAATGGMLEVKLGQLAVENAKNPEVKQFGQRMIDDHTKANKELMSLKKVDMPTKLSAKEQECWDKLSKMKGAEFDRAYVQSMIDDHKEDVALFEAQAKMGKDNDLKSFAVKTLPTLREHLALIEKINNDLNNK